MVGALESEYPHVELAQRYVEQVLDGTIPACIYVKQACQRQLNDLARANTDEFPFVFDLDKAERVCKLVSLLPHIKGKWAREGKLIELEGWQAFIFTTVFGWIHRETLLRRFQTAYDEVARKNAKSTMSCGTALYLLLADDEPGAEIYAAATNKEQAEIVWKDAKKMVDKSPGMRERFDVVAGARSIFVEETASSFKPLAGVAASKGSEKGGNHDGYNVHGAIIDELHAHKSRDMFDVIETATGAREQPLIWLITTAGSNRTGICYEQRDYLIKILSGAVEDESYFGIIYTVDPEHLDNMDRLLTDPVLWQMANPNWGVSVNPEDIARKARKAREMTSAQPNFLTKHLNVWVNADQALFDMYKLEKCGDATLRLDDFKAKPCYGGLDLASTLDVASKGLLFPGDDGRLYWFDSHYLPEDTIDESTNASYKGWALDGLFIETPGAGIDYDWIEGDIVSDDGEFEIKQWGYDPHQAHMLVSHLLDKGLEMVEIRPTVLNFSPALKELQRLIQADQFRWNGNKVMEWMFSNTVGHTDAKDNVYPRKEFAQNKIDGVIALLTALILWMRSADDTESFDNYLGNPISG